MGYTQLIGLSFSRSNGNVEDNFNKYNDNMDIILKYMYEIKSGMSLYLRKNARYPLQFDVFFVSPDAVQSHHDSHDVDLHNLDLSNYDYFLDDDSANGVDRGIQGVHRFLQTAKDEIHKSNNQRFVMLIVRGNDDDSKNDSMYIMKPKYKNSIPTNSELCDIPYLRNSQSDIVRGLSSSADGVLGFTHHWHSYDSNKVFLSYGRFKEMVTKSTIVKKLQTVCKQAIDSNLSENYKDLPKINTDLTDYWFSKDYQTFEPCVNDTEVRAKGNIFISKDDRMPCTEDLRNYIDESFEDKEKLYYNFNYTVATQIIDKQIVGFELADGSIICLLKTSFHKNENDLYVVIVPNTMKNAKQRWKVIDYKNDISEAFMTADQLQSKKGIYSFDLPKGSRVIRNNWQKEKDQIHINEALIRETFEVNHNPNVRIIQSNKNSKKNNENRIFVDVDPHEFAKLAYKALNENNEFIYTLFLEQNKYHLEKLLPVWLPEHGAYVGVCFRYYDNESTRISGIALDLTDVKNKASVIDYNAAVSAEWLNPSSNAKIINKFTFKQDKNKNQKTQRAYQHSQYPQNQYPHYDNDLIVPNKVSVAALSLCVKCNAIV